MLCAILRSARERKSDAPSLSDCSTPPGCDRGRYPSRSCRSAARALRLPRAGDERSGAPFFPIPADLGEKLLASCPHLANRSGRGVRRLVLRAPEDQLHEDGGEVDALGRQAIDHLAPVLRIAAGADDSGCFEALQALGQDVRGDPFVRGEELLIRAVAAQHEVADDQQRPAVTEYLQL